MALNLLSPGTIIRITTNIKPSTSKPSSNPSRLERSISNYGYNDANFVPTDGGEYIVFNPLNGIICNYAEPSTMIGFNLTFNSEKNQYYYTVMQNNFFPIKCNVEIIGETNIDSLQLKHAHLGIVQFELIKSD